MSAEVLAQRIRTAFADAPTTEQKMFGGICFMIAGNMATCASKRGLLVRVGKEEHAAALTRPYATAMEMRGRAMEGYVLVSAEGVEREEDLLAWLALARRYVATLPPKGERGRRSKRGAKQ